MRLTIAGLPSALRGLSYQSSTPARVCLFWQPLSGRTRILCMHGYVRQAGSEVMMVLHCHLIFLSFVLKPVSTCIGILCVCVFRSVHFDQSNITMNQTVQVKDCIV